MVPSAQTEVKTDRNTEKLVAHVSIEKKMFYSLLLIYFIYLKYTQEVAIAE